MTVLVSGATGTTGRRVADLLDARGVATRRAGRPRFDWFDPTTHDAAFDGVTALYLVAPAEDAEPAAVVGPVLRRAVGRGLRRVVLVGSSAVPRSRTGVGALYDLVLDGVPEPVVLRCAWFAQNFLGDHIAARGLRAGTLVTASGDGRVPFVDAGDIAAVAVESLLAERVPMAEPVVTGPRALSYADVCAIWTEVTGRPARHVSLGVDEYTGLLVGDGMPADFAGVLAGLDDLVRSGAQEAVSPDVERITGRPPRELRDVLAGAPVQGAGTSCR